MTRTVPSRKRFDDELLRRLRNDIPTDWLIQHLDWPHKRRDGRFRFICPRCGESETAIQRETNLGRCFHCETNFEPNRLHHRCAWLRFRTSRRIPLTPPAALTVTHQIRAQKKDRFGGPFSCTVRLSAHSIGDTHREPIPDK